MEEKKLNRVKITLFFVIGVILGLFFAQINEYILSITA